ncbi:MAG: ketopantoate reductase family protein [Promethearchaeota archaeon]
MEDDLTIVIYGAGAIGATIGGWLSSEYDNVYLLSRGENARRMKEKGVVLYKEKKENAETIPVKVIEDLNELTSIDIIMICVKIYDLENAAKDIASKCGDKPIIIGLQNGLENRKILPKYFSKVIYAVILMGTWQDEPGIFGFNDKGQLILGVKQENLQPELEKIALVLKKALNIKMEKNIEDPAHSKLVINLGNALFTLVNIREVENKNITKIRKMSAGLLVEGLNLIQAAGFKPHRLKGYPSWSVIKASQKAPDKIGNKVFLNTVEKTWRNTMVQDMILRKKNKSELEYLNGYMLNLADSIGFDMPYNRTIYELCKVQFSKTPFEPLPVEVVWDKVQEKLKK